MPGASRISAPSRGVAVGTGEVCPEERAEEHPGASQPGTGQSGGVVVDEPGLRVPVGLGQRDPQLDAVQRRVAGVETSEWLIPRPAVIRFSSPGTDQRVVAGAVAVLDLARRTAS